MSLRCLGCGYENPDEALCCTLCGMVLKKEEPAQVPPSGQAPPSAEAARSAQTPPRAEARLKLDFPRIAEDAVHGFKPMGLSLDFSLASIAAVDAFFDDTQGRDGKGKNVEGWRPTAAQGKVVIALGAYCGETARRALGGTWEEDPSANPLMAAVCFPGDHRVFFIGKAFKRVKNGSEDALWPLVAQTRKELGREGPQPGEFDGWMSQAAAFERLKRHDRVLEMVDAALAIEPSSAAALQVRGRALGAERRYAEALGCLEKAVEAAPSVSAWSEKGRVLALLGRHDEAFQAFDRASMLAPGDPAPFAEMGSALAASGRFEEALKSHDRALVVNPEFEPSVSGKASALLGLGMHQEALDIVEGILRRDPASLRASSTKARALHLMGRNEEALECAQRCVSKLGSPECRALLGTILEALGRNEEALAACDAGLEKTGDAVQLHVRKAALLEKLGREDEAKSVWARISELNPPGMEALVLEARRKVFGGGELDFAKDAEEAASRLGAAGFLADYKFPSLAAVDIFLAGSRKLAQDPMAVWLFACYVGEVLVRTLGGRWELAKGDPARSAVRLPTGSSFHPVELVKERFASDAPLFLANRFQGLRGAAASEDAQDWCEGARRLLAMQRAREAVTLFDKALSLDPRLGLAWLGKAEAFQTDEPKRAAECLDKAVEADAGLAEAWEMQAELRLEAGQEAKALEAAGKAVATGRASAGGWRMRASLLARSGRKSEALSACEKCLELADHDLEMRLMKADILLEQNKLAEAFAAYEGVVGRSSKAPRAFLAMGAIREKQGLKLEALRVYQRFVGFRPPDAGEELGQAAARINALDRDSGRWMAEFEELAAKGDPDGALRCLDKATGLDPKNSRAWMEKGAARASQARFDLAAAAFDKALELDPGNKVFWRQKGAAWLRKGDFEGALAFFDQAIGLDPAYARAWKDKALSLMKLGRGEEALSCCSKAVALDQGFAAAWMLKGDIEEKMGLAAEAAASFEKSLEAAPGHLEPLRRMAAARLEVLRGAPAQPGPAGSVPLPAGIQEFRRRQAREWADQAICALRSGFFDQALSCLDAALKVTPDDHALWNDRGNVLTELGRLEEAILSHSNAVRLDCWFTRAYLDLAQAEEDAGHRDDAVRSYQGFFLRDASDKAGRAAALGRLKELGAAPPDIAAVAGALAARHGPPSGGKPPAWTAAEWAEFGDKMLKSFDRPEVARHAFERALELDPQNVSAKERLKGLG
ncbi:MAG: tetratricopeptide repeat protein [Elusimicrobia bacterium]|nr:tetratricopeptide repeat protein [Elusimicrobiota bacterium]